MEEKNLRINVKSYELSQRKRTIKLSNQLIT